jgi:hypothetical protein
LWRGLSQITRKTPRRLTILHLSQIFLTLGLTFMTASNLLDDLSALGVELGELHGDSGSADQANYLVAQARGEPGSNQASVVEADPK